LERNRLKGVTGDAINAVLAAAAAAPATGGR
jgi:hypothetical protein